MKEWWKQNWWQLFLNILWFMRTIFPFTVTCVLCLHFAGKCFFHCWSSCDWRWYNIVERKLRGSEGWLSNLADTWGLAERFKLSALLKVRKSMQMDKKRIWWSSDNPGRTWKIKRVLNYSRSLSLRWNFKQISRWNAKNGLAVDRSSSFWNCSSSRSLDRHFRDKNCRGWFWRGSSRSGILVK